MGFKKGLLLLFLYPEKQPFAFLNPIYIFNFIYNSNDRILHP